MSKLRDKFISRFQFFYESNPFLQEKQPNYVNYSAVKRQFSFSYNQNPHITNLNEINH